METIIVGIVVGVIVGGASTWLTHNFDRWRRKELRGEERRRELRLMLEGMMRMARASATGCSTLFIAPFAGKTWEEAWSEHVRYLRDLEKMYPFFLWRPHRIKDEPLRDLAQWLQDANTKINLAIRDRATIPNSDADAEQSWWQEAEVQVRRVTCLIEAVDRRLDELDW